MTFNFLIMDGFKKIKLRVFNSLKFRLKAILKKKKEKKEKKLIKTHKRKITKLDYSNFSIISQNCWGGSVYEDLNSIYKTPTVGLFFYAPCFNKFVNDLKNSIETPLSFIQKSKYKEANIYRTNTFAYPIGLINNIEIHFLHYKDEIEAKEKWNKRKQRINWDKLFIASSDRDRMTSSLMQEFDKLPYKNKVLFTAKKHPKIKCTVTIKAYKKDVVVGDLYNQRYFVSQSFNIVKWLKS